MRKLIFATHNPNKARELKDLLPQWEVLSLAEVEFHEEIPETGTTLEENALIKARTVHQKLGLPCFADDTGLLVSALNDEPGVYSARYAGAEATSADNMEKLLQELQDKEDRSARFRTVIAYIDQEGREHLFEGEVAGSILTHREGGEGFGYDPVFLPAGHVQSFAQMSGDEKNRISHRGRAVRQLVEHLQA